MIAWLIRLCVAHRTLTLFLSAALVAGGIWSAKTITVDAIPDLSDVQVIIRTEVPGQVPEIIEDQITYPLATAMLAVPKAKTVRAFSMFGDSFLYIIFDDGTDPYWARSRVLEQLSTVSNLLPEGVTPTLGPDATGVGWVYQYMLVTGMYSPDHPNGLWHDPTTSTWYADASEAPENATLEHHRTFVQQQQRWLGPTGTSYASPDLAPPFERDQLREIVNTTALTLDPITGTPLVPGQVDLAELRSLQDWYLRYELTAVEGVSEIASVGGFVKQYQITIDPLRLLAYDIDLKTVNAAVRAANSERGGRTLERGEFQLFVRNRGYLGDVHGPRADELTAAGYLALSRARHQQVLNDLRDIAVGVNANGTPVRLVDVATVQAGPQLRTGIADWNGLGDAVGGIVIMRQDENARDVIVGVEQRLNELRNNLPAGVDIITAYDRSDLIERAIGTLQTTLFKEILAVSIVVLAFLLHARSALVAVIVLPTGVLGSLILMNITGINANIMSLGGIAIAIGVMVDSAIVMVENAHKALEEERARVAAGDAPRSHTAIITDAACEVGPALFTSLLLITVSFLPVFVLTGQSGRLFSPLAATKTFAMAVAAVLSVTLIPVLMTLLIRERIIPKHFSVVKTTGSFLAVICIPWAFYAVPGLENPGLWTGATILIGLICLLKQPLHDEERHPLTRFLRACYEPVFATALTYPKTVVALALAAVCVTVLPGSAWAVNLCRHWKRAISCTCPIRIPLLVSPKHEKYYVKPML